MPHITAALRRLVVARASNHCEYCGLAQDGQVATFHIDHVTPVAASGATSEDNLALACVSCSLRKGARQTAIDFVSGEEVPLFNPRNDDWHAHFYWDDLYLVGRTPTGRATVVALAMNRTSILMIRGEEADRGRHPYPTRH